MTRTEAGTALEEARSRFHAVQQAWHGRGQEKVGGPLWAEYVAAADEYAAAARRVLHEQTIAGERHV